MVASITSYGAGSGSSSSSSSSGASDAVNQVVFEYDDSGRLVAEYEEHDGVKDANTPYIGYRYDDSSKDSRYTNGLRLTAIRYPNGREVHYTYGTSGSTADAMSRIDAICDDDYGSPGDALAKYEYLGFGTIVQVDYPEPHLRHDLAHSSGDDPYDGLDRFGRVFDLLWREDPVATGSGKDFDELYQVGSGEPRAPIMQYRRT